MWRQCQGEQRFILGEHTNGAYCGRHVGGREDGVLRWQRQICSPVGFGIPASNRPAAAFGGKSSAPPLHPMAAGWPRPPRRMVRANPFCFGTWPHKRSPPLSATNFWLRDGSITFSPDSKWLAFATSVRRRLRLWDVNARSEVTNLPAYSCIASGPSELPSLPTAALWLTMKTSTARFCSGTSPAVR